MPDHSDRPLRLVGPTEGPTAQPVGPDESPPRPKTLAAIATAQHGLFTRAQALDAGYTVRTLERRIALGEWTRRGSSVLGHATAPTTYRQAVMAAVLSFDGAVASHEAAATLHGFRYLDTHPIAISVPPAAWHQLARVQVHRYRDLSPEWVTSLHGIPLTTPERTIIDLGAVIRTDRLGLILDSALGQRQLDLIAVTRAFNRMARRGRHGIGRMRVLLEQRGEGFIATGSKLERRFLSFVTLHHLPEPAKQLPTFWNDRLIGLADFAYPDSQLLVELDGRLGHSQLIDFELDRLRDQRAMAAGWRVIRITWKQLHERPDQVLDVLNVVLRSDAA